MSDSTLTRLAKLEAEVRSLKARLSVGTPKHIELLSYNTHTIIMPGSTAVGTLAGYLFVYTFGVGVHEAAFFCITPGAATLGLAQGTWSVTAGTAGTHNVYVDGFSNIRIQNLRFAGIACSYDFIVFPLVPNS